MNTLNALQHKEQIKEQIAELVERLEEKESYSLDFYEEYSDDFAINEDLNSMIIEWSWSLVDECYSSLWTWVREHTISQDYIQQAVAEGLIDCRNFDFYKAIQAGQYLFYSDEVYADYATLEQLHKLHQELHELEQEQAA